MQKFEIVFFLGAHSVIYLFNKAFSDCLNVFLYKKQTMWFWKTILFINIQHLVIIPIDNSDIFNLLHFYCI